MNIGRKTSICSYLYPYRYFKTKTALMLLRRYFENGKCQRNLLFLQTSNHSTRVSVLSQSPSLHVASLVAVGTSSERAAVNGSAPSNVAFEIATYQDWQKATGSRSSSCAHCGYKLDGVQSNSNGLVIISQGRYGYFVG